MTTHAERVEHLPVGSNRLWAGMLTAPAAWVLTEGLGYYLAARSCELGAGGVPLEGTAHPAVTQAILSLVALLASGAGLFVSLGNWRAVRSHTAPGDSAEWGRAHFMAFGGVLLSVLFLVGIVLFALPAFIVSPCSQARLQ